LTFDEVCTVVSALAPPSSPGYPQQSLGCVDPAARCPNHAETRPLLLAAFAACHRKPCRNRASPTGCRNVAAATALASDSRRAARCVCPTSLTLLPSCRARLRNRRSPDLSVSTFVRRAEALQLTCRPAGLQSNFCCWMGSWVPSTLMKFLASLPHAAFRLPGRLPQV